MTTLNEAIDSAEKTLTLYDRVHEDLDEMKTWEEIDNGFREDARTASYDNWYAYMQQRLIGQLREIVLVRQHVTTD